MDLSNSSNADSQYAEATAEGDNAKERNATSNELVFRISTDNSQTFGSFFKLGSNGTLSLRLMWVDL